MKELKWKYGEQYRVVYHSQRGEELIIAQVGWLEMAHTAIKFHRKCFPPPMEGTGCYRIEFKGQKQKKWSKHRDSYAEQIKALILDVLWHLES